MSTSDVEPSPTPEVVTSLDAHAQFHFKFEILTLDEADGRFNVVAEWWRHVLHVVPAFAEQMTLSPEDEEKAAAALEAPSSLFVWSVEPPPAPATEPLPQRAAQQSQPEAATSEAKVATSLDAPDAGQFHFKFELMTADEAGGRNDVVAGWWRHVLQAGLWRGKRREKPRT